MDSRKSGKGKSTHEDPGGFHLGRLLQNLAWAYQAESSERLAALGWKGLSLSHTILLANLEEEGNRCTVVTERAGIRKQSMGAIADLLVKKGCLLMEEDPSDRRARIMRFTVKGRRFLTDANRIIEDLEQEYRIILGEEEFARFKNAISRLADSSHPVGSR